jgi:hypothetical protein
MEFAVFTAPALKPTIVEFEPVCRGAALAPIIVLEDPIKLAVKLDAPIATFDAPVVTESRAVEPYAVFEMPVIDAGVEFM